jgi:hypothetical protein
MGRAISVYVSDEAYKLAKENKLKFSKLLREKIKEELENRGFNVEVRPMEETPTQLRIRKNLEILKKIQIENPYLRVKGQVLKFKELTGLSRIMFFRYKRLLNGKAKNLDFQNYSIDKTACFFCQKKEKLIVHHLDFNHTNNNPENLVVLCTNCHRRFHQLLSKSRRQK